MTAAVRLLSAAYADVEAGQGGYYVLMFHDGAEFDRAGPFEDHDDAEGAMERALRVGGAL